MTGFYNLSTAEIFTEDGWKAIQPNMPIGVMDHCMVLINSTTAMLIGGKIDGGYYSKRTYFYNFDDNTWISGPDLKFGRYEHVCGMVKKNGDADEVMFKTIQRRLDGSLMPL